jgi:uncharacterized membrane protein YhhN
MLTTGLSALAFACATTDIIADYIQKKLLVYLFKPLTIVLIILIAWTADSPYQSAYKTAVLAGLLFSLLGDIFLMLPRKPFIPGLASFLAAHICYIIAFLETMTPRLALWPLAPLLIFASFVLASLFPGIGKMKLPVIIYMLVITAMGWLACERGLQLKEMKALSAGLGALLFLISDSSLAVNRFLKKRRLGQALTLSTYFLAQWFIALSV